MSPLVEVRNLGFTLPNGERLFSGLEFDVCPGKVVQMQGPNGSGKTSLIRLLLDMNQPTEGDINWHIPYRQVGYLPQNINLGFFVPLLLGDLLNEFASNRIDELGLLTGSQRQNLWNTASGGERQKALISRLLLSDFKLLVLDEPFNHLDAGSLPQVFDLLKDFLQEGAILIVSHTDISDALPVAHKLILGEA